MLPSRQDSHLRSPLPFDSAEQIERSERYDRALMLRSQRRRVEIAERRERCLLWATVVFLVIGFVVTLVGAIRFIGDAHSLPLTLIGGSGMLAVGSPAFWRSIATDRDDRG